MNLHVEPTPVTNTIESDNPVDASIVVCTFNRAEMLREALSSLICQRVGGDRQYEILVVDNGSTDDTPQVISETQTTAPVLVRAVRETREGVSHARNRGVEEARGQWIAFFDDDQLAEPDWLAQLLSAAEAQQVQCVGGGVRLRLPEAFQRAELAPMVRTLLSETVGADTPRQYDRKFAPGTGNLMIHRSVFDEVGLFRTDLQEAGEDTELYRRIRAAKIRCWYTPAAVVHHVTPPYRLEPSYLRWTALRVGGHVARRERNAWGSVLFPLVITARLGQATLVFAPRLLAARLRGDQTSLFDARCWLWHAQGYVRFALRLMLPNLFGQQSYLRRLVFRSERQTVQP